MIAVNRVIRSRVGNQTASPKHIPAGPDDTPRHQLNHVSDEALDYGIGHHQNKSGAKPENRSSAIDAPLSFQSRYLYFVALNFCHCQFLPHPAGSGCNNELECAKKKIGPDWHPNRLVISSAPQRA
jgi:hypothetical protein